MHSLSPRPSLAFALFTPLSLRLYKEVRGREPVTTTRFLDSHRRGRKSSVDLRRRLDRCATGRRLERCATGRRGASRRINNRLGNFPVISAVKSPRTPSVPDCLDHNGRIFHCRVPARNAYGCIWSPFPPTDSLFSPRWGDLWGPGNALGPITCFMATWRKYRVCMSPRDLIS